MRMIMLAATLTMALLSGQAFAQDDDDDSGDDDVLGEILGDDDPADDSNQTAAEEKEAVQSGDIDDRVGVQGENLLNLPEEGDKKKRLIKTLAPKNFFKIGRWELGPHVGFVTNDPFINRILLGLNFARHFTELFAIELRGTFSPDLGQGDWKPITKQLVLNNKVSPDISKIIWYSTANFQFSPIYGKIAVGSSAIINFDIYGLFGVGVVGTKDDLEALQQEGDQEAIDTQNQVHFATSFGGGFRIVFSRTVAARIEGTSLIYIETISSTTLEMKNNFTMQASVTFFFPGMK